MGKWANDDYFLDVPLDYLAANGNRLCICSAQPTTYAQAITTYELADVTLASGDYTVGDGDSSGRKVTIGAKSSITIDASGDATHVAIVDTGNTRLLYVTTCATTALTIANTCDTSAWDIEIADPV